MRQEHTTCMHPLELLPFFITLDKFYAVLLFVSLLLDCMNVHIGADLEVLLAGDGRVQHALGVLLGVPFGALVGTTDP